MNFISQRLILRLSFFLLIPQLVSANLLSCFISLGGRQERTQALSVSESQALVTRIESNPLLKTEYRRFQRDLIGISVRDTSPSTTEFGFAARMVISNGVGEVTLITRDQVSGATSSALGRGQDILDYLMIKAGRDLKKFNAHWTVMQNTQHGPRYLSDNLIQFMENAKLNLESLPFRESPYTLREARNSELARQMISAANQTWTGRQMARWGLTANKVWIAGTPEEPNLLVEFIFL